MSFSTNFMKPLFYPNWIFAPAIIKYVSNLLIFKNCLLHSRWPLQTPHHAISINQRLATFQSLMNDAFKECLRKFILVFFDDVLAYSRSETNHQLHLYQVLQILATHHLYAIMQLWAAKYIISRPYHFSSRSDYRQLQGSGDVTLAYSDCFKGLAWLPWFNWILPSFCSTLWEYRLAFNQPAEER